MDIKSIDISKVTDLNLFHNLDREIYGVVDVYRFKYDNIEHELIVRSNQGLANKFTLIENNENEEEFEKLFDVKMNIITQIDLLELKIHLDQITYTEIY
ncbi:hypothetical protein MA785_000809 [Vibrio parahaemolyticus]|nr:hypothetical protein [Vibrio parahaemolyticus]EJR2787918.1 hypothetical protein [Vibrio parahaemolyticus]